jgi:hypothetical protein
MADIKETCFETTNEDKTATVCSSEKKWINKVFKLREKHPDQVHIMCDPEKNHGVLVAKVPKSWMKLAPPRQTNYTDEQRAAMVERLAAAREKKEED